ncbi:peptidoglycan-binding protein [Polymorphospora sp. NPDC050346]|uniref:peptidoglycan-binding protein n=1 Tax=Polymorphospora sp. NPDC050346 TaxID=3155780 RepID=UPI0033D06C0A
MNRRAAGLAAAAVVVAVAGGVAAVAGRGAPDPGTPDRAGLPPATAVITRQTLVDAENADGELGYGTARTVNGRLTGTLTALAEVGATVRRGQVLYRVDDVPVVLLHGPLPAYRTLAPSVEGADVRQFERNLRALGYTGFTADDHYTGATADAVRRWQRDLGVEPTGRVEPGHLVHASGDARIETHQAAVGDATQSNQPVLTVTGTVRLVTVTLPAAAGRLAAEGAAVTVTLPDGRTTTGRITAVRTVVTLASDTNPTENRIEVTVTGDDPDALAGHDHATVTVAFTASRRDDVLTVPVAALLALAEGGYGVEVVDGSTTRVVAVETGLFAAGRVEVTGAGLAEGQRVGVPR